MRLEGDGELKLELRHGREPSGEGCCTEDPGSHEVGVGGWGSTSGWYMPAVPASGRLRQEDCALKPSLGHIERPCLKKRKNMKKVEEKREQGRRRRK